MKNIGVTSLLYYWG